MYPLTRRLNLTLAGFGGRDRASPAAPPPAAVPPAAPVAAVPATPRAPSVASSAAGGGQGTPANVRNTGGARGLDVMGTTQRALKSLTGQ